MDKECFVNHLAAKTSFYLGLFPWDSLPQAMLLRPRHFKRGFNLEVSIWRLDEQNRKSYLKHKLKS